MKRIYACFAIVAALLATAFYSSFQVQRFADDISTDLDCAIEAIRNSDLPTARQALARPAVCVNIKSTASLLLYRESGALQITGYCASFRSPMSFFSSLKKLSTSANCR